MKAIAIDDEPIALTIIQEFCRRIGGINLLTFTSAREGMQAVWNDPPQVLFLDIRMGNANGVELARNLPMDTQLIFTTAYTEYAFDGFELNAVDYLHKPFSYERFQKAVTKARQQLDTQIPTTITLKVEHRLVPVTLTEIIYIEALDNYVRLYLTEKRKLMSQMTMTELVGLLPKNVFVRIHRSFIVNRTFIESFNRQEVYIKGLLRPLPIGRTYSAKAYPQL